MISHGKDIKIFTGNANPKLAADICKIIGTKLGESEVKSFADGEASVSLYETVRGSDVFLVQSTCKPVNDSLMELLIMVDACRRASAGRITAVMPYFGYARQDRKAKSRDPISAKLVANLITRAGADRVATGENPVIVACRSAQIIVGPIGIAIADALMGEISPAMANAVASSNAYRVLIPMNLCSTYVAGVDKKSSAILDDAMAHIRLLLEGMENKP